MSKNVGSSNSQSDGTNKFKDFDWSGGYYIFPNGLIMQWGFVADPFAGKRNNMCWNTIKFPIPFPHTVFSMQVSVQDYNGHPTPGDRNFSAFNSLTNEGAIVGSDHVGSSWFVSA